MLHLVGNDINDLGKFRIAIAHDVACRAFFYLYLQEMQHFHYGLLLL
jgi:hypothetical protein